MDAGKKNFNGKRGLLRSPILLAALALTLFGAGAALGWSGLNFSGWFAGSPEIVRSQPLMLQHNQYHHWMHPALTPVQDPAASPEAVLPVRSHDFGRVRPSETVSRVFEIANRGSTPLVISNGYTTCSCTTAEISAGVIPPGKSGLVTVTFTGSQVQAGTKVRRGVVFETNDPMHPQIEVWIQATVSSAE